LKITFLGTGTSQGVPVVACQCNVCQNGSVKDNRLRSSVLIEDDETVVIIDAGPDFRYQMLREGVKKLDAILVTHPHKDHIGGMDDVRSFNWLTKKAVDIYATPVSQQVIKNDFFYAFEENAYPGVPSFNLHSIGHQKFKIKDLEIDPLEVLHMKMPVLGFRIGDFAYITDANYIPLSTMKKLIDCKVIVLNALRKEKHISHFNLVEAVEILEYLRPEKAYLTHISHLMGFHDDINKELPDFIRLAYDRLKINI
jgi:phosphoribosyl 1,2-cyclic phosphate phosphodiesterase